MTNSFSPKQEAKPMIKTLSAEVLEIPSADGLDAITVFFQDFEPGRGRVTLECWGNAWSCYFGAMGNRTIREFFLECGPDYLENKLGQAPHLKQIKRWQNYLGKIIKAAQLNLRGLNAND